MHAVDLAVPPGVVQTYLGGCISIDHASAVAAPKSDPVFLHVKAGMTVIVTDTEGAWRMADVIWIDGGARNPKAPTLFQVADVDTGVINWVNADLVTHIVPRCCIAGLCFWSVSSCTSFRSDIRTWLHT